MIKHALKKLVVYSSLSGNTQYLAQSISSALECDIVELKIKNMKKRDGFSKYFFYGMEAVLNLKPELLELPLDPQYYDLIFLGSPIWGGKYSSHFNTFFSNYDLRNINIGFFYSYAGNPRKAELKLKNNFKNNEVISSIGFQDALVNESSTKYNKQKIVDWSKKVLKSAVENKLIF